MLKLNNLGENHDSISLSLSGSVSSSVKNEYDIELASYLVMSTTKELIHVEYLRTVPGAE